MSPRKEFPDEEPDDLIGRRELQRLRKGWRRSAQGKPSPSALAEAMRTELWVYRQMKGLTQEQLGQLLDMKQSQIARLESGFVEPSMETLLRISERLGIDFTIEVKSGVLTTATPRRGSRRA